MVTSRRVALITGCGKAISIGAASARALAASGISVVVSDIEMRGDSAQGSTDPAWRGIESLVEEIQLAGGTASWTRGDVTSEADTARMVSDVLERYGRLDILANNAGAPHGKERNEIEDVPLDAWERVMAINARGVFLMTRASVPSMRKQKWGRIINISSSTAYSRPRIGRTAVYAASKAAVIGFTKCLSVDLAPLGITVNAIAPGAIKTARAYSRARQQHGGNIDAEVAAVAKYVPVGRYGDPEEVASMIAYLASEGSSYITGQVFGVNGGTAGSL